MSKRNIRIEDTLLDDGHGNKHSRYCEACNKQSIYIYRKNDFRCRYCYKETWVTVDLNTFFDPASKPKQEEISDNAE